MGYPVRTLDLQNLPEEPESIYVLTTNIPYGNNRIWSRVYDKLYKDKRLYLYKGIRIKEDIYHDEQW